MRIIVYDKNGSQRIVNKQIFLTLSYTVIVLLIPLVPTASEEMNEPNWNKVRVNGVEASKLFDQLISVKQEISTESLKWLDRETYPYKDRTHRS